MSSSFKQVVTVGDMVRLEKGLTGTVQFVGEITQRKGIYYGIELEEAKGKSNGQVGAIRYFQCKNKYGLFLRFSRIQKVIPNKSIHRIGVNDLIQIYISNKQYIGVVRFIGKPSPTLNEIYYGIEFDNPMSNSDGIFENIRYFKTKPNCAYFIKASNKYIHKIVYKKALIIKTNSNSQIKSIANTPKKHSQNGHIRQKNEKIELKIHFEQTKQQPFIVSLMSNFSYNDLKQSICAACENVSNVFEIRFEPHLNKQGAGNNIGVKIHLNMSDEQLRLLRLYNIKFYELGIFSIIDPLILGIAFEDAGQFSLAVETYEKAMINGNGKCIELLIYYANALVQIDRFNKAEEIYKLALNLNPFCGEICYFYTRLLEYKQKYKQIASILSGIGKLDPLLIAKCERINYRSLARLNAKYIQLFENRNKYIRLNEKMEILENKLVKSEAIIENKNRQLKLKQNEINLLKNENKTENENKFVEEYEALFTQIFSKKEKHLKRRNELRQKLLECENAQKNKLTECKNDCDRQLLMKNKLQLCEFICNFQSLDNNNNLAEKKKNLLLEVLQSMSGNKWNNILLLEQCIQTISSNLFRSLPSPDMIKTDVNDDEMDFRDPSWQHLQLIYELTFHVVTNTNIEKKLMKKYLCGEFLENLIYLFHSSDDREPQYVKIIVHAIYGRFMALRKSIRKYLSMYCFKYIYESTLRDITLWQGLPEILEIFCSIFQGLNVPVKPEYHIVLRNVIVPLHKSFHLDEFHEQLLQCCTQFVTKDVNSAPVILGGILKFWPKMSPLKEQLFINEIVHILNVYCRHPNLNKNDNIFIEMTLAVLNQFIKCIYSTHHQVAERSLMVWRDETVRMCVDIHKEIIWPNIYAALQLNKKLYWLPAIRDINRQIMVDFRRRDPQFFKQIETGELEGMNGEGAESKELMKKRLREKRWLELNKLAGKKMTGKEMAGIELVSLGKKNTKGNNDNDNNDGVNSNEMH